MIVLVGFMGAGKSTVGPILARKAGLPFLDTDDLIAERAQASISEVFERAGEGAFRDIEREIVAEVLAGREAVVALGGGALGDPATCAALRSHTVIHLAVDLPEALRRLGSGAGRPMLTAEDPQRLYGRRLGTYEELSDDAVITDGQTPEEVADEIIERLVGPQEPPPAAQTTPVDEEPRPPRRVSTEEVEAALSMPGIDPLATVQRIRVPLRDHSYDVVVGTGISAHLEELVPISLDAERAFVVTHEELLPLTQPVKRALEREGTNVSVLLVPEGEDAKSLDAVARLYDSLVAAAATRHDIVVGVGGGVVTDIAGFAASTFNRGMPLVNVPTTLLAQVDAAVGGKTGVNLAEAKNKIGTFHQPIGVVCDVTLLKSLPLEELHSGLAEVVKYGLIADPSILKSIQENADDIEHGDPMVLSELVSRSIAVKAEIVAADEREAGRRALLNYGHTIGHAIEAASGYGSYRHGEAIALGMMAAAYIAEAMYGLPPEVVETHRSALSACSLPVSAELDVEPLERAMAQDKKARGGVRFVLLKDLGQPEHGVLVPPELVRTSVERLRS